jgi:hypothetical protein
MFPKNLLLAQERRQHVYSKRYCHVPSYMAAHLKDLNVDVLWHKHVV